MPMKRGAAMTEQDELDKALDELTKDLDIISQHWVKPVIRKVALAVRDADWHGGEGEWPPLHKIISALARKKEGG